jgi:hypothetical protein
MQKANCSRFGNAANDRQLADTVKLQPNPISLFKLIMHNHDFSLYKVRLREKYHRTVIKTENLVTGIPLSSSYK